jgi:hypothetical protein
MSSVRPSFVGTSLAFGTVGCRESYSPVHIYIHRHTRTHTVYAVQCVPVQRTVYTVHNYFLLYSNNFVRIEVCDPMLVTYCTLILKKYACRKLHRFSTVSSIKPSAVCAVHTHCPPYTQSSLLLAVVVGKLAILWPFRLVSLKA